MTGQPGADRRQRRRDRRGVGRPKAPRSNSTRAIGSAAAAKPAAAGSARPSGDLERTRLRPQRTSRIVAACRLAAMRGTITVAIAIERCRAAVRTAGWRNRATTPRRASRATIGRRDQDELRDAGWRRSPGIARQKSARVWPAARSEAAPRVFRRRPAAFRPRV